MIQELIQLIEVASGLSVIPFQTEKIEPCVIYKYYPQSDDGAVTQYRLELRVIAFSLGEAEEISNRIRKAIITIGDSKKIDSILSCNLNGGGVLKDNGTNTTHKIMYFNMIVRS